MSIALVMEGLKGCGKRGLTRLFSQHYQMTPFIEITYNRTIA
jgi:deoxyadenosine/deoxycytidine kinase